MRRHYPHQPVADEPAGGRGRHDLRVLAQAAAHLQVTGLDGSQQRVGVDQVLTDQLVHLAPPARRRYRGQEVHAAVAEGLHLGRGSGADPAREQPEVLAGQVAVLLRAGQGELLGHGLGVQHEPGVGVPAGGDVAQRTQRVEAREQRRREARRPRASSHSDDGPARIRMPWWVQTASGSDPLRVVPHPVRVDHPRAGPPVASASRRPRSPGPRRSDRGGGSPQPAGQFRRTRSKFPPIPPLATTTAGAEKENSPTAGVRAATPRGSSLAPAPHRSRDAVGARLDRGDPVPRPDPYLPRDGSTARRTADQCRDRCPR